MLRISVHSSNQLQAVILATKQMDRENRKQIRQHTRQMLAPEWKRAVAEHASTRLEHRVLVSTARVQVSDQNVTLKSAHIGRALKGGLLPSKNWPAVEFGGKAHQLRRYKRSGHVLYPSAADIIPRLAALWAQTTARTIHEAFESE